MKSEVIEIDVKRKKDYPVLKISENGTIVLFIKKDEGVCLSNINNYNIGDFSSVWVEEDFDKLPIGDKVILEND